MKSNKGFSLVELIVVIAIMAIIAAVAIPVYSSYITKANTAKDDSQVADVLYASQLACTEYSVSATFVVASGTLTVTFTGTNANAAATQIDGIVDGEVADNVYTLTVTNATAVSKTISTTGAVA